MQKWLPGIVELIPVVAIVVAVGISCSSGSDEGGTKGEAGAEYKVTFDSARGPAGPQGPAGVKGTSISGMDFRPSLPTETTALEIDFPYGSGQVSGADAVDRMIVRTARMNLKVADVAEAMDRIAGTAQSLGGYVVSSDRQAGEDADSANISIRVPAAEFESARVSLRDLAIEVLSESTSAEDVTWEYTDLDAQLRNLEATEQRYLQLLEKAETVEEMLKVEEQLSETRGEIERIEGRMQYLEKTAAMSLIQISLVEESPLRADFEADKIKVEAGQKVYFTDETKGGSGPYGYTWVFGDGDTESSPDPGWHKYDEVGTYTVSLTVVDGKGNESVEIKEDYITVVGRSGWSPGDIARGAWDGLVAFGHFLGHVAIWIGILSVVWVPVLAVLIGIRRRRRA